MAWTAEVGDSGLFRVADGIPGLEQGGGDARGCWKGDEAEGEGLGRGEGCLIVGLDL